MKKIFKNKLFYIICTILILYIGFQISLYKTQIKLNKIPFSTTIYDKNWKIIGEIIKDQKYRHNYIKIQDTPNFFKNSLIQIEDENFYNNNGISYPSIIRATINNIKAKAIIEGGSTISSQLIRNSIGINKSRNFTQKIKEFYLALALNKQHEKDEILERYINILSFGNLCYGPQSAARYYFGKDLHNLTKAEQLALLTIPKNPNIYNPISNFTSFHKRFQKLAKYLVDKKYIDQDTYYDITNEKLLFNKSSNTNLPYISDFIKLKFITKPNGIGYKNLEFTGTQNINLESSNIYSTIDYDMTKLIEKQAQSALKLLEWKGVTDYGILIVDRETMGIKVLIGGADYTSSGGQVNAVTALRQPGSSIKPFTYLLAFKEKGLGPNDTIEDLPVHFETAKGYSYTPKNYSLKFKGQVSLASALSESLNVPAVKILNMIGTQKLLDFLRDLGISSLNQDADFYGLALTLGVGEISLYELTRAYSIFANGGKICELKILENEEKFCTQKFDNKYIEQIIFILTNRYFKINGFPINSNLDFKDRYVFVKTGTSREFKDNFAIGFTKHYLIGVWVGNKSGEKMKLVTGVAGAGEIFRKIVYTLEQEDEISQPAQLDVQERKFLEIIGPANGSKYKIQPNKNNQNIKLEFNTNYSYTNFAWILDGQQIDGEFINPGIGEHKIKILLFDGGKKIEEKENIFYVE